MKPSADNNASTQTTQLSSYRDGDVIPEGYIANVLIFFVVFIALALVTGRFIKDKFPLFAFRKTNRTDSPLALQHTIRVSPNTKVHVVQYAGNSVLLAESSNNVTMQLLDENEDSELTLANTGASTSGSQKIGEQQ